MHRGKPKERMLDGVIGEDRDRALGRKAAREERRADAPHARHRLPIGETAPIAVAAALRKKETVRHKARPMRQALGEARGIRTEPHGRTRVDRSVDTLVDENAGLTESYGPQRF